MPVRARQLDPNPRDPGTSSSSSAILARSRLTWNRLPREDGVDGSMGTALAALTLDDPAAYGYLLDSEPSPPDGPNPRDPGKKRLAPRCPRRDSEDPEEAGPSPRDPGRSIWATQSAMISHNYASPSTPASIASQRAIASARRYGVRACAQPRDIGY